MEIDWEPLHGIAINRNFQILMVYDITLGFAAKSINPLECPFPNEEKDEIFELSEDEILKHVVAEIV